MNKPTFTADGLRVEVVEFLRRVMEKGQPLEQMNAASMLLKLAEDLEHEAWEEGLSE